MATMKDVAKKANVGIATVSRVLNNSGFVSEETRSIVERVIDELGYVPNELARNFQKNKTNVIAVLVPEIKQQFTNILIQELEEYMRSNGYMLMLGSSNRDMSIEREYIDKLKSQHVAGIIITAPFSKEFRKKDFPIVSFDRNLGDDIPYVYTNNYDGGAYLTRLLLDKGCKSIAYVDFCPDKESLSIARKKAFVDVCCKDSITYKLFDQELEKETQREYIERIFKEVVEFDGVVFGCDYHAKIFTSLCAKYGVNLPVDIQVVSYDAIAQNDDFHPIITSVGHDFKLIAKTLVDIIFKQMNNSEYDSCNELDFVIRDGETTI